jgi:IclR family transcriptional regulator, acetate operon repressor
MSRKTEVRRGVMARYALILDTVAASRFSLSLSDIIRGTGLSNATVHRLVNSLVRVGYLADEGRRKAYGIGPRLIRLFHLAHSPTTVELLVRPVLERLVEQFGETSFVAKLNGEVVESIVSVAPENYGQSHVQPGRIMPINAAASAKAIFAYQPKEVVSKVLRSDLQKFTNRTITDAGILRRNLEQVRLQGYAKCADELDSGVLSFACPIHLPSTGVIYSVGIVALSRRLKVFDEAEIIASLRNAAQVISTRLQGEITRADIGASAA